MKLNAVSNQPLEVKRGNVTVNTYTVKNRVNGGCYPQFTLVYYSGDQRVKRKIAAKRQAGRGVVHIKDMESRLGRFADSFQMKLEQV